MVENQAKKKIRAKVNSLVAEKLAGNPGLGEAAARKEVLVPSYPPGTRTRLVPCPVPTSTRTGSRLSPQCCGAGTFWGGSGS